MLISVLILAAGGEHAPDTATLAEAIGQSLADGRDAVTVCDHSELLTAVQRRDGDRLVLIPDGPGMAGLIRSIRQGDTTIPVIAVAHAGSVESTARAIEAGATDYLVMGPGLNRRVDTLLGKLRPLFHTLERNRRLDEQNAMLRRKLGERFQLFGRSPAFHAVLEQIRRVAKVPRPVLILGERGTGKELVAHAIHAACNDGNGRAMVTVNCAALNEQLLESELFGHEKGAFTGAEAARAGLFEQAHGSTLFLDEIGNMPISFQRKILRVVEYPTFTRVGGVKPINSDVRIIAATNRDLQAMIRSGEFLSDLYDRISFEIIRVPALRERPDDIEELAERFLEQFAAEVPTFQGKRLAPWTIEILRRYPFPGNVRELKNIIERAAYRDTTNEITPEDVSMLAEPAASPPATGSFQERLDAFSRQLMEEALAASQGNQAAAARRLGLTYDQFRHYRRKHLGNKPHLSAE